MNRLMIASAVAVAAAAVSVPAVAGLANNPSFSHRVPVHVPSRAKLVQLDDHGQVVDAIRTEHPASTAVTSPGRSGEPEPGDTHGQSTEPGDDRGQTTQPEPEPGDDRGQSTAPGGDGGRGGGGDGGGSGRSDGGGSDSGGGGSGHGG